MLAVVEPTVGPGHVFSAVGAPSAERRDAVGVRDLQVELGLGQAAVAVIGTA
jgi:hypothetical protein